MSARSTRHPFTHALYEKQADGNVLVTDGAKQGLFRPDGRWISGDLREADPQLCVWVSAHVAEVSLSDSRMAMARKAQQPQS
jgi:hypothetical protein